MNFRILFNEWRSLSCKLSSKKKWAANSISSMELFKQKAKNSLLESGNLKSKSQRVNPKASNSNLKLSLWMSQSRNCRKILKIKFETLKKRRQRCNQLSQRILNLTIIKSKSWMSKSRSSRIHWKESLAAIMSLSSKQPNYCRLCMRNLKKSKISMRAWRTANHQLNPSLKRSKKGVRSWFPRAKKLMNKLNSFKHQRKALMKEPLRLSSWQNLFLKWVNLGRW